MGWIADVVPEEVISSTMWGNVVRDRVVHVFDSDADRAATANPRVGMMSWTLDELRLSVWLSSEAGWLILWEPWRAWTPDVWSGPTSTFPMVANRSSQWRHIGFEAEVFLSVTVTLTSTVPEDLIFVLPPVAPNRPGPFGVAVIQDPTLGTLGPTGMCDPTTLAVQQLGTGASGLGSLIHRADLSASGNIDIYMSGRYAVSE
jgi:hypothetical protein